MTITERKKKRVKTPTVLQMEAVECGAAALAILLGYYGRFVPLEELRIACGISRDGSKAGNILKAARAYGLQGAWYRRSMENLLQGSFPVMVFWNFNHFLVVEGCKGESVFLNDPATGPRRITLDEFSDSYTGIVLEMEPGEEFQTSGKRSTVWASLQKRMRGQSGAFAYLLLISLLLVVPTILVPGLLQVFINQVLVSGLQSWLGPLVIGLFLALVATAGLNWLQSSLLLRVELRFALAQSAYFMWHILRLPQNFFDQRYTGDISSRVSTIDKIATLIGSGFGAALLNSIMSIFVILVMLNYSPILTAIAVITPLMAFVMLRLVERRRVDTAMQLEIEQAKLIATSVIGLRRIETLKATGAEDDFFNRWAGYHARTLNTEQHLGRYEVLTNAFSPLFQGLTTAAILGVGSYLVIIGQLTLGALIAFQVLALTFQNQFKRLIEVVSEAQTSGGDIARLDDALRHDLDWRFQDGETAGLQKPQKMKASGQLSLKDVSFRFSPLDPPFLEGLTLDVAPGEWLALVGSSGSGKSTTAKLISGLYQPTKGEISLDGFALESWGREKLAFSMATVDQKIAIFEGTLSDNITLWDSTIPHKAVVKALQDAQLMDVVAALPGNFDGWLEEGGRNLSGGQRQRVEIARALVRNPSLVILDEATSALDPITELRIAQALRRRGCAAVIVAHRLSTIRDANEIVVLKMGKVVERGRHEELIVADGEYQQLIADE